MPTIYVTGDKVADIVRATFPDYTAKKFAIQASETITLHDLNWSGGTRSQYRTCTLDGQPTGSADKFNAMAPWDNPAEGQTLPIPAGFAVVRSCMFCGKDLGLTITVNPADMPKYITAPVELSADESKILSIIRGYKSQYRRDYAKRANIDFDSTVALLKTRGFLTPQGGLTIAGKNTVAQ